MILLCRLEVILSKTRYLNPRDIDCFLDSRKCIYAKISTFTVSPKPLLIVIPDRLCRVVKFMKCLCGCFQFSSLFPYRECKYAIMQDSSSNRQISMFYHHDNNGM